MDILAIILTALLSSAITATIMYFVLKQLLDKRLPDELDRIEIRAKTLLMNTVDESVPQIEKAVANGVVEALRTQMTAEQLETTAKTVARGVESKLSSFVQRIKDN